MCQAALLVLCHALCWCIANKITSGDEQARERQRRLADREAKCSAVEEAGSRLGAQRKDLQGQERELQEKERAVEKLMAKADRSRSEAEALLASHKVLHRMHGKFGKFRIIVEAYQDQCHYG